MALAKSVARYPLEWPAGWRRADSRKPAAFLHYGNRLTVDVGVNRVLTQLELLGVRDPGNNVLISTNVRLRMDGYPRSDQAEPSDPGVAVYWMKAGWKQHKCMPIDRYTRVADNLGAIAATLEAMRKIERHGGAVILDRAFMAFVALPQPEQPWQVLGLANSRPTRRQIDDAYGRLASQHHPDKGGDESFMKRINLARDELWPDAPP